MNIHSLETPLLGIVGSVAIVPRCWKRSRDQGGE